jgi:hypothetical protein
MQQHIKIMINTAIVTPMINPMAACFLWVFIQSKNMVLIIIYLLNIVANKCKCFIVYFILFTRVSTYSVTLYN